MKITAIAMGNDSTPTIYGLNEEDNKVYIWDAINGVWKLYQTM